MNTTQYMSMAKIRKMVRGWLANPECCFDRLAQIHGEELAMLERDGAGLNGSKASSKVYEAFAVELDYEYAVQEDEERTHAKIN